MKPAATTEPPAPMTGLARERKAAGLAKPSRTAEINTGQRHGETLLPPGRRLFEDPYARRFLRAPHYRALAAFGPVARTTLRLIDWRFPGMHALIVLRYRFSEEALDRALAEGVDQVVLLGAGYDSLAFRRDLGAATLFEVDVAPTQQAKLRQIEKHGLEPRGRVVYVSCDFEAESPSAALSAHGFDASRRCFVVWYGVSMYLSVPAVEAALADVAAFSSPGSVLVWDYLDASIIDGTTPLKGARRAAKTVRKRGEPYIFGLTRQGGDELTRRFRFGVREHLRVPELAERYGPPEGAWCATDDTGGVISAERSAER